MSALVRKLCRPRSFSFLCGAWSFSVSSPIFSSSRLMKEQFSWAPAVLTTNSAFKGCCTTHRNLLSWWGRLGHEYRSNWERNCILISCQIRKGTDLTELTSQKLWAWRRFCSFQASNVDHHWSQSQVHLLRVVRNKQSGDWQAHELVNMYGMAFGVAIQNTRTNTIDYCLTKKQEIRKEVKIRSKHRHNCEQQKAIVRETSSNGGKRICLQILGLSSTVNRRARRKQIRLLQKETLCKQCRCSLEGLTENLLLWPTKVMTLLQRLTVRFLCPWSWISSSFFSLCILFLFAIIRGIKVGEWTKWRFNKELKIFPVRKIVKKWSLIFGEYWFGVSKVFLKIILSMWRYSWKLSFLSCSES